MSSKANTRAEVCSTHHREYRGKKNRRRVASRVTVTMPCFGLAFGNDEPFIEET